MQERIEASNKMLREKFYDQMIEGKVPLDLKGLSPDTVKYLDLVVKASGSNKERRSREKESRTMVRLSMSLLWRI